MNLTNLRRRVIAGASIAALATAFANTAPAAEQQPYIINGIFSQTGPAAFTGQAQMRTLMMLETVVNRTGGIRGRPLKFVFADDQTSAQTALQLAAPLIEAKVPIIMGPSVVPTCAAIIPMMLKTETNQPAAGPPRAAAQW